MLSDVLKCIDGPLEGQEVPIDRRLMKVYDHIEVEEIEIKYVGKREVARKFKTGLKYKYTIRQDGLYYE